MEFVKQEFSIGEDLAAYLEEGETVEYQLDDVEVGFNAEGTNTEPVVLYITTQRLLCIKKYSMKANFVGDNVANNTVGNSTGTHSNSILDNSNSFNNDDSFHVIVDVQIREIALHAVTKDPSSYPKPCVYCQLDVDLDNNTNYMDMGNDDDDDNNSNDNDNDNNSNDNNNNDENGNGNGNGADSQIFKMNGDSFDELFLVPSESDGIMALFNALSQAFMNNPDLDDGEDSELYNDLVYNNEEVLSANGINTLAHLDSILKDD